MTSRQYILDNYNLKGITANAMSIGREENKALLGIPEKLKEEPVRVGRFDSVYLPFAALFPQELSHLLFGLGIGNVDSDFRSGGAYQRIKYDLGGSQTTLSMLIWETGLLGTLAFSLFLTMVFFDAYAVARANSDFPGFGAGFASVAVIFVVCLLYTNLFHAKEITILYMYFAGFIVALRTKQGGEVRISAASRPALLHG
jgi:hypothetical protein